ncbi:MAG: hypothetical protein NZ826_06480 [Thermodesulfovibrio sp.]|nr:hypothetical protein [Thermodesulfovibrio sp.]
MFYIYYDYEEKRCYDVDCGECKRKLFCIHYTPDPDGPAWQNDDNENDEVEYRLFVEEIDDTTNILIRNVADIILKNTTKHTSGKNVLRSDVIRLVKIWYNLGYKVKDVLYFRDFYTLLNAYYKYILPTLSDTVKLSLENYLFEYQDNFNNNDLDNEFSGDIESDNDNSFGSKTTDLPIPVENLREIIESLSTDEIVPDEAIDLWLLLRTYSSFNGYVKVKEEYDPDHPDNIEFDEQDQKISQKIDEAYRLIKEIFLVTNGKTAYAKSEKLKNILREMKTYANAKFYDVKDLTRTLKRKSAKAWELRKKYKNCSLEEKREIFKKELGY